MDDFEEETLNYFVIQLRIAAKKCSGIAVPYKNVLTKN